MSGTAAHGGAVPFRIALKAYAKIAALSFGGPAGQIAVMHRILVEEERLVSEARFLHALNFCMLLPGPEAQQTVTYVGWLLHGWRGGLAAGSLFILPGFLALLAISWAYVAFAGAAPLDAVLFGLKPAVLAIVLDAVIRVGRRALKGAASVAIAAAAFVAVFAGAPFPAVVAVAGIVGFVLGRTAPAVLGPIATDPGDATPERARSLRATIATALLWLAIWAAPVVIALATVGSRTVLVDVGLFFSKVACVTFGGAYAVLAYVGRAAVDQFHWLTAPEMIDGLGFAETTPGPLIMVLEFVGFLAGHRDPGRFDPWSAALLAAGMTTWVTFAPCFLWIFTFAPYVERLRGNRALASALAAITAAVVGVIANLGVWFGAHVLVDPGSRAVSWPAVALFAIACALTFAARRGLFTTLAVVTALGAVARLALA